MSSKAPSSLTASAAHASGLRQMLYTLSRFRFHKPAPPFELGGEYLSAYGQHCLKDAEGNVALLGPLDKFKDLKDGDLIIVNVSEVISHQALRVSDLRMEFKTAGGWPRPSRPHATHFRAFVRRVQSFFVQNGFTEIQTPTLVTCPGLEPSLEPFSTTANFGRREQKIYLPTSPEIHLKKAMASGYLDIFEIKNCFRRGEFSTHHENEFAMLEWYRGFAGLEMIEKDLLNLLETLAEEDWVSGSLPALKITDFKTLFQTHLQFELTPKTTADELRKLCRRLTVETGSDDTFNDLFHRILIDRLETVIAGLGPVIIKGFPPSQAALAKLDSQGWADRFEFYWNGLEIANAFNEVNDPEEQRRRWEGEQSERKRLGTSDVPQDLALLQALGRGIPSSGGIALGVDRLYMACAGLKDIRELRLFSVSDVFEE